MSWNLFPPTNETVSCALYIVNYVKLNWPAGDIALTWLFMCAFVSDLPLARRSCQRKQQNDKNPEFVSLQMKLLRSSSPHPIRLNVCEYLAIFFTSYKKNIQVSCYRVCYRIKLSCVLVSKCRLREPRNKWSAFDTNFPWQRKPFATINLLFERAVLNSLLAIPT